MESSQILYNELRKINRSVELKKKELSSILEMKSRTNSNYTRRKQKPKRYSVEIEFDAGDLSSKSNSFTVDRGVIFRPESIDSAVRSTFYLVPGDPASSLITATLPFGDPSSSLGITRNGLFSFLLSIRDTGSDREWQNHPIPDSFLLGGMLSPFNFGENAVLSQGTEVFFDVNPQLNPIDPSESIIFLGSVVKNSLIISMSGFEEIL